MSNTMNVSYMSRVYNNFINNYETQNSPKTDIAFGNKVAEKRGEAATVSETQSAGTVSNEDMTMEEYKQYIYDKISQLPMHPSNMNDSISIQISEAGFEAMKNDPEYEKWVLDSVETNFMFNDPWSSSCGGKYAIFYFGATKEESRGESWRSGYQGGNGKKLYNEKSQDSFWERKAERKRRLEEQYKEMQEKKVLAEKLQQRQYYAELTENKAENSQLLTSWNNERQLAQASAAYETNVTIDFTEGNNYVG